MTLSYAKHKKNIYKYIENHREKYNEYRKNYEREHYDEEKKQKKREYYLKTKDPLYPYEKEVKVFMKILCC